MAKDDFENGVWRTVGGRRIFIRDGEDLASAMKRSGKFKSKKDIDHQKRKVENEMSRNAYSNEEEYKEMKKDYDAFDKLSKEKEYTMDGKKITESDIKSEYDKERKAGNIDKDMSYEDYKSSVVDDKNSNVRSSKDNQVMSKEEYDKLMRESGMYEKHKGENTSYKDYIQATKDVGVAETNKSIRDEIKYQNSKEDRDAELKRRVNALVENGTTNEQGAKAMLEHRLGMSEKALDNLTTKGKEYEKMQGVQKLKDKLSGNKEQDEVSTVRSQMSEIEQASGSKVKDAFQTDLFGNGKENRFILEDGTIVGHTLESFGQKTDDWYVGNRHFKNYDEVKKYLSGESGSNKSNNTPGSTLKAYSKAFEEYKKKHPNTKLTINQFVKYSEGKK